MFFFSRTALTERVITTLFRLGPNLPVEFVSIFRNLTTIEGKGNGFLGVFQKIGHVQTVIDYTLKMRKPAE